MSVVVLWDQTRFDAALAARVTYAGRTVRQSVVTAAYWISVNAKQAMPFVPIGRIDTELAVKMVPGKTAKNRPSKAKKNRIATGGIGDSRTPGVPLAVLIVVARAKPGSRYNVGGTGYSGTNSRYALAANPFRGKTAAAGREAMKNIISRMIKARHSSPHFLQIGWNPVIRGLLGNPDLVNKYRRGGEPSDRGKKWNALNDDDKGALTIDLSPDDCTVTIENNIGDAGTNQKSHRAALLFYGSAALQVALDKEAALMEDYMRKHSQPGDDAFNALMR